VNRMVEETIQGERVEHLISVLYLGNHIDEMTKTWLCQTPEPPHIPIFYTLTKIHKRPQSGDLLYQGVTAQLQQRN